MYPLFNVRERRGVQSLAHWHWHSLAVHGRHGGCWRGQSRCDSRQVKAQTRSRCYKVQHLVHGNDDSIYPHR